MIAVESVVSTTPFVLRRQVRWSECDPAGVVFAGNFSLYIHHALEQFRASLFDRPWHEMQAAHGVAMPAKALNVVFHRALWPGETFDMNIRVIQVGTSTVRFSLAASVAGQAAFDAQVTSICIAPPVRKSVPVPDALRKVFESHIHKEE